MYYLTRNTIHNNIVCLPSKCSLGAITEDLCQKIGKMNPLKRKSVFFWSDSNTCNFLNMGKH